MVIQYVASVIIGVILVQLVTKIVKDKIAIVRSIFWVIFWLATLTLVWFPEILAKISNIFGVGRGVDILIYISIIFLFYIMLNQNTKIDKLENKITTLVREIAKNETRK